MRPIRIPPILLPSAKACTPLYMQIIIKPPWQSDNIQGANSESADVGSTAPLNAQAG